MSSTTTPRGPWSQRCPRNHASVKRSASTRGVYLCETCNTYYIGEPIHAAERDLPLGDAEIEDHTLGAQSTGLRVLLDRRAEEGAGPCEPACGYRKVGMKWEYRPKTCFRGDWFDPCSACFPWLDHDHDHEDDSRNVPSVIVVSARRKRGRKHHIPADMDDAARWLAEESLEAGP